MGTLTESLLLRANVPILPARSFLVFLFSQSNCNLEQVQIVGIQDL